jgi:hypothetical protein
MNYQLYTMQQLHDAAPAQAEALMELTGCGMDCHIHLRNLKTVAYVQVVKGLCSYGRFKIDKRTGKARRVA